MVEPAFVVKGGEILDSLGRRRDDVLVGADGTILAVGRDLDAPETLDASGCVVTPGFVDLHTHLREPGGERAETVLSGSRAAAAGGFTAVVAMPNTDPPVDNASMVREIQSLARGALCDVVPAGAITIGRAGEQLVEMADMVRAGVRMFTDDGRGVQDAGVMRRALLYARDLGVVLAQHCEVESLSAGGVMHEGRWSSTLGLPGVPAVAEELMVARDIALCRTFGGRIHLQHISTRGSVELVKQAKLEGLDVTAEVTPHHLSLLDAELASFDPVFKVNPPLREEPDVQALRSALADGHVDAVATDHAPHPPEEKERPLDEAPPGMTGLETALAAVLTHTDLPLETVVAALSWRPAAIAGLEDHGGPIEPGRPANICVFSPEERWRVEPASTYSLARNNPFVGRTLTGRVRHTVYRGEVVVREGEATR
ncbi:MAG: dihydroorotase [Acidimicrobiales bacterium]|nr:MAG: dihydroorotase [Acidimicrobiales bacterium]